jgi:hypothetical protein
MRLMSRPRLLSGLPARCKLGFWRGALYALATATTARWGLPPLMWGHGGDAIDLRRDLAELMELPSTID